jgi:hypothetical protein
MRTFCGDLGKLGFVWQFVTLAGFHLSALNANRLCRTLTAEQSMLGYVEGVQRPERNEGVDTLTHQRCAPLLLPLSHQCLPHDWAALARLATLCATGSCRHVRWLA